MEFVFVSYAHVDSTAVIPIVKELKAHHIQIWMDRLSIQPGKDWRIAIESAITRASHVLVFLSPAAIQSKNVQREYRYAQTNNKTIVPVMISPTKLPMSLENLHYINLTTNYESGLKQLITMLPNRSLSQTSRIPDLSGGNAVQQLFHMSRPQRAELTFPEDRTRRSKAEQTPYPVLEFTVGNATRTWPMMLSNVSIGRRWDCEIVIEHSSISRLHVNIYRQEKNTDTVYFIKDLGSKNGTWVNDRDIRNSSSQLKDGDIIKLGSIVKIAFKYDDISSDDYQTKTEF